MRLIAFRRPPPVDLRLPLRVIGVDLNSRYGLTILVFDVTESSVRMAKPPMREMPPNDSLFLAMASVLRKIAQGLPPTPPDDADDAERRLWALALERVGKLEREVGALTTERADRLRRQLERAARIARQRWARKVICKLRTLIREVGGRVVIAADLPRPESLKKRDLQKTYLRVAHLVENLCAYEGALFLEVRASGKVCPICNRLCKEVEHRYYACVHCGIVVDRDYGGSFNAILKALPPALAQELRGWLRSHPKALARNYANPAGAKATAELNRLRGAPLLGTPSGRAQRPGALLGGRVRDEGESSREALRRRSAERREQAAL